MCLALGTVVSAVSSLNVALPDVARGLHASQTELQWMVDAYALAFAGLLLPAGALADRLGRRSLLLTGLALFSAAAAAALFIESAAGLIAVRAVMGLGAAAIMPATLATITAVFPGASRDRAVSIWAGVAGGSALAGLLVSGLLLEAFSWQSVFALSVVLGLSALAVVARVAPESRAERAHLDLIGGVASALALSSLVFGIIEGPARGWGDTLTAAAFAVALACAAGFLAWELHRPEPLLDPRLFRLRGFTAGTASILVQFFAFFGFIFVVLQYVQFVLGYSPFEAGLALAPMAVLMMGLSPRVPRLLGIAGPARLGALGLLSMSAGCLVFSSAGTGSSYWLLLAGIVLLGTGAALATTPATAAIVAALPAAKQGVASAVNDAAREVGGALGIAVLGSALTDRYQAGVPDHLAGVPAHLLGTSNQALPAAIAVAERLGPKGAALATQAQAAFVDGFVLAMSIAAAAAFAAAAFVFTLAPARVEADTAGGDRRVSELPAAAGAGGEGGGR